jgi:hypothetical protein
LDRVFLAVFFLGFGRDFDRAWAFLAGFFLATGGSSHRIAAGDDRPRVVNVKANSPGEANPDRRLAC